MHASNSQTIRELRRREIFEVITVELAKNASQSSESQCMHRTIKSECLERMIFFGEDSLRKAVGEFLIHYHTERNHQGLENRIIVPDKASPKVDG